MERHVFPGEFYRHFKNKLYQIIAVAIHSETGEQMVVYQALYGTFQMYVRPLSMFLSPVDRGKYPDVTQKYRFERVFPDQEAERVPVQEAPAEEMPHPGLVSFLEAESLDEKIEVLERLKKTAGQKELDSLYVVLDIRPLTGTLEEQLEGIRRYLHMQNHYDGGHLR